GQIDLLPHRVEHVGALLWGDGDPEWRTGGTEVHDADRQAAVQGYGVAGIDRQVDGSQRSVAGRTNQVLGRGLTPPGGSISPPAEQVAYRHTDTFVPEQRRGGFEIQERGDRRRGRELPERPGELCGEGPQSKQRVRI